MICSLPLNAKSSNGAKYRPKPFYRRFGLETGQCDPMSSPEPPSRAMLERFALAVTSAVDRREDLVDELLALGEIEVLSEVSLGLFAGVAVQRHVQGY